MEKNWALSVDQYWLKALHFSVHLIDLLRTLLRGNSFTGIQKAVWISQEADHQTMTMTFLVQVWLWDIFSSFFSVQLVSWSSLPVV